MELRSEKAVYYWKGEIGQGLINLITPTNTILPVLQMTNITYDKYLKWVMPLFGLYAALGVVMLIIETMVC